MAEDVELRGVLERERIASVVHALFGATDKRDWDRVRGCFAELVTFDMTSLAGGEPARLSPGQISAAWESGLRPIEAVHHQTGNLEVSWLGDEATATCYGIAWHYRKTASGRNTRVFVGSYDFHLVREATWKIDLFRFNCKFVDGNLELEKEPA
jgi:hypothetical protein